MTRPNTCSATWALLLALIAWAPACGDAAADTGRGDRMMFDSGPEVELGDAPVAPMIPAGAPTVAFLGDSITAGLHLPSDQAFPAVTQRLLAEQGLPFRVVDAGVSGDTSAGGKRRLDWVLRSAPDVVVIELGGNDGLRGKPVGDIKANLAAIVAGVRDAGALPLLVGMVIPPNYGPDYTRDFSGLYEQLAEELDVPLVPRFMERIGGKPEFFLGDRLHPNPSGHRELADVLAPHLSDRLAALAEG